MSAATLVEPKKTPFTVGDIKPIITLANCNVLVTTCNPLSSAPLTIDNLAEICILCKFLIQGIRAHGMFKDLSIFNFSYKKQLGELIDLYEGLKNDEQTLGEVHGIIVDFCVDEFIVDLSNDEDGDLYEEFSNEVWDFLESIK